MFNICHQKLLKKLPQVRFVVYKTVIGQEGGVTRFLKYFCEKGLVKFIWDVGSGVNFVQEVKDSYLEGWTAPYVILKDIFALIDADTICYKIADVQNECLK